MSFISGESSSTRSERNEANIASALGWPPSACTTGRAARVSSATAGLSEFISDGNNPRGASFTRSSAECLLDSPATEITFSGSFNCHTILPPARRLLEVIKNLTFSVRLNTSARRVIRPYLRLPASSEVIVTDAASSVGALSISSGAVAADVVGAGVTELETKSSAPSITNNTRLHFPSSDLSSLRLSPCLLVPSPLFRLVHPGFRISFSSLRPPVRA
mmetsp:Transcript_16859/g.25368  ORF Transcript_16859/g.25368 Transcript_16859/m.25368 type:complete len:218 (-) Transcript_16859:1123-1776(-)